MNEEPGRGQERAGSIEARRIVHEEQLRLTRTPRRVVEESVDQGVECARLDDRIVVQKEDEVAGGHLGSLVAGADEPEVLVVPDDPHMLVPVGQVCERSRRCVVDDDDVGVRLARRAERLEARIEVGRAGGRNDDR